MSILKRVSSSFWSYLSPQNTDPKTVQTPRMDMPDVDKLRLSSPTKATTRSSMSDSLWRGRSMSPTSRVDAWQVDSPATTVSDSHQNQSNDHTEANNGETPAAKGRKRKRAGNNPWGRAGKAAKLEAQDLEGDTLMDAPGDNDESALSVIHVAGQGTGTPSSQDENEGEETFVDLANASGSGSESELEDMDNTMNSRSAEKAERQSASRAALRSIPTNLSAPGLLDQDWPSDIEPLLLHLANRGREPLLTSDWKLDFSYMPTSLFTPSASDALAVLKPLNHARKSDSTARASGVRMLHRLIEMPSRIRDKVSATLQPEPLFQRYLTDYHAYTLTDASLGPKTLPLILIQTAPRETGIDALQKAMRTRFAVYANKWISARITSHLPVQEAVPSLYGLMVSHTLVALMSYTPPNWDTGVTESEVRMRHLAIFDLGDARYDVWNAFAFAILGVHERNTVRRLVDRGWEVGQHRKKKVKVDVDL